MRIRFAQPSRKQLLSLSSVRRDLTSLLKASSDLAEATAKDTDSLLSALARHETAESREQAATFISDELSEAVYCFESSLMYCNSASKIGNYTKSRPSALSFLQIFSNTSTRMDNNEAINANPWLFIAVINSIYTEAFEILSDRLSDTTASFKRSHQLLVESDNQLSSVNKSLRDDESIGQSARYLTARFNSLQNYITTISERHLNNIKPSGSKPTRTEPSGKLDTHLLQGCFKSQRNRCYLLSREIDFLMKQASDATHVRNENMQFWWIIVSILVGAGLVLAGIISDHKLSQIERETPVKLDRG